MIISAKRQYGPILRYETLSLPIKRKPPVSMVNDHMVMRAHDNDIVRTVKYET